MPTSLRNPFSRETVATVDLYVGLRSWGLILYGALPASLAMLGFLDVKIGKVDDLFPFLLPASALPVLLTFLLIRARQKEWYLTTDHLNLRSAITTPDDSRVRLTDIRRFGGHTWQVCARPC